MPYEEIFECVSVYDIYLCDVAKDAFCSFVFFTKLFSTYCSMHPNDVGTFVAITLPGIISNDPSFGRNKHISLNVMYF